MKGHLRPFRPSTQFRLYDLLGLLGRLRFTPLAAVFEQANPWHFMASDYSEGGYPDVHVEAWQACANGTLAPSEPVQSPQFLFYT